MLITKQLITAFIMGMVVLLIEIVGDRLGADESTKILVTIMTFVLMMASISIIAIGGALMLCKILVNLILFFTLIFLPVILYNIWRG